jgi:hypothetical protein
MAHHGFDVKGERSHEPEKRRHRDIQDMLQRQEKAQRLVFDKERWKDRFVQWVVRDNQSLLSSISPALRALMMFQNPIVEPVFPRSHNTTRSWIITKYEEGKAAIVDHLAKARSTISISFDGWKADNDMDLLGILAHYLDHDLTPHTVLLGLRETFGSHSGDNMSEHLLAVLHEFKVTNWVWYYIADNASNNGAALKRLADEVRLHPMYCKVLPICLRCLEGVGSRCGGLREKS